MEETCVMPSGYTVYGRMKVYEATATVTGPDDCEWPAEEAGIGRHMKVTVTAP